MPQAIQRRRMVRLRWLSLASLACSRATRFTPRFAAQLREMAAEVKSMQRFYIGIRTKKLLYFNLITYKFYNIIDRVPSRCDGSTGHERARVTITMLRRKASLCRLAIAVLLALGACQRSASALERVTYLLPAPIFLPAFGPWIVARARRYYDAEGLDVHFETARGGADVAKQVGVGNAVIGGAMGDTSIIVRGNGVPVRS